MSFHPRQAYNDLPLLPPPCELETKRVLKKCVAANRALAELKGAGDLIPNMGSAGQSGFHDRALAKGPGVVIARSGVGSMGVVTHCATDYWPHTVL
jgi:hypothetical protein